MFHKLVKHVFKVEILSSSNEQKTVFKNIKLFLRIIPKQGLGLWLRCPNHFTYSVLYTKKARVKTLYADKLSHDLHVRVQPCS